MTKILSRSADVKPKGDFNLSRLSMSTVTPFAIAALCGVGFLSCKNSPSGRSMETGVNPATETEGVTEISSAADVVIPGDGKITIDAYRKDDDEDDYFKLVVSPTAVTGASLALASAPLKLAETYKCTVTIRKVNQVSFQMVDVLTSAATACEPLPSPAAGFNFKISGVEADSLYLATLHVVPDSTPNLATTVKAVLPPISDECRGDQARFTMMADALTNGAANLILELVKIANSTSSVIYSADDAEGCQGFRTIQTTEAAHPYAANWWPPGHIIGYEHSFVHAAVDFIAAVASGGAIEPNFASGVQILKVLEAGLESARTKQQVVLQPN